jgi:hypothetical protein
MCVAIKMATCRSHGKHAKRLSAEVASGCCRCVAAEGLVLPIKVATCAGDSRNAKTMRWLCCSVSGYVAIGLLQVAER